MKCQRCNKSFIDEEFSNHLCSPETHTLQEIGIHNISKPIFDENLDRVFTAIGLNGICYKFVECIHNPIHTNNAITIFENEIAKVRFERHLL